MSARFGSVMTAMVTPFDDDGALNIDASVKLYDVPIRTGRRVARDTFVRLSDVGNIVGVKDAALDVAGSAALRASMPESFEIYSGNDDQTVALMAAAGAVGVISVASHWCGVHMAEMVAAVEKGDLAHAREVNNRLLASYDFETSDAAPNPIPTKAMMRVMGHDVGQCRLPMGRAPEGLEDEARRVLANLQRG